MKDVDEAIALAESLTDSSILLSVHFLKQMEVCSDESVPVPPEPSTHDIRKALLALPGKLSPGHQ